MPNTGSSINSTSTRARAKVLNQKKKKVENKLRNAVPRTRLSLSLLALGSTPAAVCLYDTPGMKYSCASCLRTVQY